MGETATISLEDMTRDDLDQVIAIDQTSFTMPWARNLFLSEFRNLEVSLKLVARIREDVSKVVGYIVCWIVADEVHILDLATEPNLRRTGIARRLVLEAIRKGIERGAKRVFLEVRASNTAALVLYDGIGFSRSLVRTG